MAALVSKGELKWGHGLMTLAILEKWNSFGIKLSQYLRVTLYYYPKIFYSVTTKDECLSCILLVFCTCFM